MTSDTFSRARYGQVRRGAFTLVELLVVIAMITLLIALVLPSLGRVRVFSREFVCQSQLRQVGLAFLTFSGDHRHTLPGCYRYGWVGEEPWQKSWMGSEAWPWGPPDRGSLLPYLGGEESALALYRCPSLPAGVFASGVGSNGYFDYGSFLSFSGARRESIPLMAQWTDLQSEVTYDAPTPLIAEEDPLHHMNACCIEPGHSNTDSMGTWHRGGSFYFSIDARVHRMEADGPRGPTTWDWEAQTPSGAVVPLTSHGTGFGGWQTR